jgi:prephenate dehydratase
LVLLFLWRAIKGLLLRAKEKMHRYHEVPPQRDFLFYTRNYKQIIQTQMTMINPEMNSASAAEAQQRPVRVAIQGYSGAFHEIAARYWFQEEEIEIVPALTFEKLVELIEQGAEADTGLMAIENTLGGTLMPNYRLLNDSRLKVVGEAYLRIQQNLMALPGQTIDMLTEVHSHPMAIAQCREFFRQYPSIRLVEAEDTALSARHIRDHNLKTVGAIASSLAAGLYGLEILAEGIETNKKNHTRFLVLNKADQPQDMTGADKVSLCFSVEHQVGSLYKVLAVLAAYNVNLTKIQSTPIIGKPWEYMFFLDFVAEGKVSHDQAIEAIRPLTHYLKVLGAYKRGRHFDY